LLKSLLPFLLICQVCWSSEPVPPRYEVVFNARFKPDRGVAEVRIDVSQARHELRLLDFAAEADTYSRFAGDGEVTREGGRLVWNIPKTGGGLSYEVRIDHHRGHSMDAHMTGDWAILRLDDLFPPARVVSLVGAESASYLQLSGPDGWVFESRYGPGRDMLKVDDDQRRFDRPTGWLAAGILGIRRDVIAGRRIAVAAPVGQGMPRLEILAFLRWTLPSLVKVFPGFPDRLLIVGARDRMWRGGLSAPRSIYLHSDRPLISENATSALLHELVHMVTGELDSPREDWVIEGLAEYYSLEILRRSGGISRKRFDQAMAMLDDWAEREQARLESPSTGAGTARAVVLFNQMQLELAVHDAGSLDRLVRRLLASGNIEGAQLLTLSESVLEGGSVTLREALDAWAGP